MFNLQGKKFHKFKEHNSFKEHSFLHRIFDQIQFFIADYAGDKDTMNSILEEIEKFMKEYELGKDEKIYFSYDMSYVLNRELYLVLSKAKCVPKFKFLRFVLCDDNEIITHHSQ